MDGSVHARAFLSHVGTLAVMCPAFLGGRLTAGPDGIRGSRPNQLSGGKNPMTELRLVSIRRSDRRAIIVLLQASEEGSAAA